MRYTIHYTCFLAVFLSIVCLGRGFNLHAQNDSVRFSAVAGPFDISAGYVVAEFDSSYNLMGVVNYTPNVALLGVKFDKRGNQIKSNQMVALPEYNFHPISSHAVINNKVYMVGEIIWQWALSEYVLYCLDSETDSVFCKIFDKATLPGRIHVMKKHPSKDEIYYVGTRVQQGAAEYFLMTTDTLGNILYVKGLGAPGTECKSLEFCDNGDLLFAGIASTSSSNKDFNLIRTDSLGNLIWQNRWSESTIDMLSSAIELESGNIFCVGRRATTGYPTQNFTALVSPNGALLNETLVDSSASTDGFLSAIAGENSTCYALANSYNSYNRPRSTLYKIDTLGRIHYTRYIEYDLNTFQIGRINYFERSNDKGFLLAGTVDKFSSLPVSAWLVKLDSVGCLVEGCDSADVDISLITITQGESMAMQSWPNPANDYFFCNWPLSGLQPNHYRVVNITGQLVEEGSVAASQNNLNLNLTDQPAGVYFLSLYHSNILLITKKIVKQ